MALLWLNIIPHSLQSMYIFDYIALYTFDFSTVAGTYRRTVCESSFGNWMLNRTAQGGATYHHVSRWLSYGAKQWYLTLCGGIFCITLLFVTGQKKKAEFDPRCIRGVHSCIRYHIGLDLRLRRAPSATIIVDHWLGLCVTEPAATKDTSLVDCAT